MAFLKRECLAEITCGGRRTDRRRGAFGLEGAGQTVTCLMADRTYGAFVCVFASLPLSNAFIVYSVTQRCPTHSENKTGHRHIRHTLAD